METLLPALILLVVALVGARVSFSTDRIRLGPRLLFRTGAHFVVVGFLLGPSGLGLLTSEATEQLSPLLALGLGWVGFHFGLQLDRRALDHFPKVFPVFALGQAILTFLVFAAVALPATRLAGLEGTVPIVLVLGAAATAAVTTPAGIAMVSSTFRVRGNLRDLLLFVGSIDALVGIVVLQITYAFYRPVAVVDGIGPPSQLVFVGSAVGIGLVCGFVFLWLTRSKPAHEELVLYLLGACAFASGLALQWDLSPLFVSVTMGALVANLSRTTEREQLVLSRWEKPVYVSFLLVAGALIQVPTWIVFPVAVGYALLRFVAKVVSARALVAVVPFDFYVPGRVGFGLMPQGGISIAMAVSAVLLYPELEILGIEAEAFLLTVVVIGVALAELTGPFLTLRLLQRAGHLQSETPAKVEA